MLIPFAFLNAQEYGNRHFQIEDGLPGSIVYSVTMDKMGRILFGTDQGISVYNGKEFRNIGRREGLKETEVLLIYNDSKDRTWVTTFGSNLYCFQNGKISIVYEDTAGMLNHSKFILEDSSGDIFIAGRHILKLQGEKFTNIQKINYAQNIFYYEKGDKRYFVSIRGVTELNKKNETVFYYNDLNRYYHGGVKWKGKLLFYYQNGIDEYEESSENNFVIKTKSISKSVINRIKVDAGNNLWILTNGDGALRVDAITGDTTRFIPGSSVSDLLIDKEQNIWLTTLGEGIYKIYFPVVKWYSKTSGMVSDHFLSVASDGADGIIAGDNNGNVYHINADSVNKYRFTNPKTSNRILDLLSIDQNYFYAASDEGLIKFNYYTGTSVTVFDTLRSFKFIRKTSKGNYLTGTYKYGLEFRSDNVLQLKGVWEKRTMGIEETDNDGFYLASTEGLFECNSRGANIQEVDFFKSKDRVNYILKDKSGVLWIATYNSGLYAYGDSRLINITDSAGLAGNSCKHIFTSADGDIYVSTDKGVSRIKTINLIDKKFQIINYTTENGLPSNETNQCVVIDNKLWVATGKGLVVIEIQNRTPEKAPMVVINSIASSDSIYSMGKAIKIPYSAKYIDISFEGISISSGKNLIFKYRVNSVDKAWSYSRSNSIRYASLSPGNYTFQIVAINQETLAESNTAEIKFTILTPFWRSSTFIVLVSLFTIALIWLVFKWRIKKLQGRADMRNRMLSSEIKSIRSQMDPHFIFNALNSIQGYVLKNEKLLANQYLTSFSRLMRMVLENSNRSFVTIQEEIEFLELYLQLEQLRLNNKFTYSIEYDKNITIEITEIPGMVLQPLVENAVIHGIGLKDGPGHILVKFEVQQNKIFCIVEDDGAGFSNLANQYQSRQEYVHTSFGFKAIEERIKLLNSLGRFKINFRVAASTYLEPGKGTRVEIEIEEKVN
ncbi:MAG TPA: histidine kinase [Bacteroidia bacterium]|nr:histidine kinase [Bacteroidia bacterium]